MDTSRVLKGSLIKVIAELRTIVPKGTISVSSPHCQNSSRPQFGSSFLTDWTALRIYSANP